LSDEYAYLVNLSEIVFFLDQNLSGRAIPQSIVRASNGCPVEIFINHFEKDTEDVDWLPEIARRKWILLTKDRRITQRPLERQAIINSNGRAFILTSPSMSGDVIIALLKMAMPHVLNTIRRTPAPFIFGIDVSGVITSFV
jgi:PIN like domain